MKSITTSLFCFETLRREDFLYVDKTAEIYKVFFPKSGQYFLARPRRFGKSLLISTLKAIFEGKRELFRGLAIDSMDYDWKKYPVIHLDMGSAQAKDADELRLNLTMLLKNAAADNHIDNFTAETPQIGFIQLIRALAKRSPQGQVVLLVDEYDKPILGHLGKPDITEIKEKLKAFYSVIKTTSPLQRFALITGVSKFSKFSIFSDLNNLTDLTMDARAATLLGYTREGLKRFFSDRIDELAHALGKTREDTFQELETWYDGYRFHHAAETVFNPVSIGKCFEREELSNYWFETGTPTFLLKLLKQTPLDLGDLTATEEDFSVYEPEAPAILPLLVQTGYLTIKAARFAGRSWRFKLGFPNAEVSDSFNRWMLDIFSDVKQNRESYLDKIVQALEENDLEVLFATLSLFFANIPYDITLKNEKYYQSIFYAIFCLIGAQVEAETRTNIGRIDAVVKTAERIFLFEFKLNGTAEEALAQIKDRKYQEKYAIDPRPVTLLGVAFDPATRNIGKWIVDRY